jgi:hypothetical protein
LTQKRQYSIPIYSALRTRAPWRVGMSDETDPVFTSRLIVRTEHEGSTTNYRWDDVAEDVFDLRRRVFDITTVEDAKKLFEECGPWQVEKVGDVDGNPVRFSGFIRSRDFFKHALLERSIDNLARKYEGDEIAQAFENAYLWSALPMELLFRDPPVARVVCKDIQDSLRASVFLDRLDGFRWKRCKRQDCGQVFELKSKHDKVYCCGACARLQAARDHIKREKAAKMSRKLTAKKGKR